MRYCWDTVEHLVPAENILIAMADAGFQVVSSHDPVRAAQRVRRQQAAAARRRSVTAPAG